MAAGRKRSNLQTGAARRHSLHRKVSSFAPHAAHNAQGNPKANTQQEYAEWQTRLTHLLRRIQPAPRTGEKSERLEPPRLPGCPDG